MILVHQCASGGRSWDVSHNRSGSTKPSRMRNGASSLARSFTARRGCAASTSRGFGPPMYLNRGHRVSLIDILKPPAPKARKGRVVSAKRELDQAVKERLAAETDEAV